MSNTPDDDDQFDWNAPMPDEMKHTMAVIEKLHPDFAMTKWNEIGGATGMTPATAKLWSHFEPSPCAIECAN
ncbi:hypothetical protein PG984_011667 [Apiospora sp. TS-2023a]